MKIENQCSNFQWAHTTQTGNHYPRLPYLLKTVLGQFSVYSRSDWVNFNFKWIGKHDFVLLCEVTYKPLFKIIRSSLKKVILLSYELTHLNPKRTASSLELLSQLVSRFFTTAWKQYSVLRVFPFSDNFFLRIVLGMIKFGYRS